MQICKKILILSTVSFLIGSLFHFMYDLFPNLLFSLIFPINESVWEHLKLCFYPVLAANLIPWGRIPMRPFSTVFSREILSPGRYVLLVSCTTCHSILITLFGYYGLSCGFLLRGLPVDLLLYFFSLAAGYAFAFFCCLPKKDGEDSLPYLQWQLLTYYLIFVAVVFMLFSLQAPDLPVFQAPD